ncbi:S24 family peptidase [Thalassobaculum sp.]|uniref:XRE family transcriptional regulator n=1 Tax=Thalassobaculum sp. TaxID=2022740 RepID=UPI0032EBB236
MSARDRLRIVRERLGESQRSMSTRLGLGVNTWSAYERGESMPKSEVLVQLTSLGFSIDWLLIGDGPMMRGLDPAPTPDGEFLAIPRYDAVLAAGHGSLNERSRVIEHIPFPRNFIIHKLGKRSTEGLAILEARGDSMEPTIGDGDLVMVDQTETEARDGLIAFVMEDTSYIKRLRFGLGGVEVISDNRELYPPERLSKEQAERLTIIGRVRWVGKAM